MISSVRSRRLLTYAVAVGLFLTFLAYYSQTETNGDSYGARQASAATKNAARMRERVNPDAVDSQPSPQLVELWRSTLDAMMKAEPRIQPIKLTESVPETEIDPKYDHPKDQVRREFVILSESDKEMLKATHAQMIQSAKQLGPRIHYAKHFKGSTGPGPRGIVMTAGAKYIHNAIFSLHMLRRSGSILPVQLFLDGAVTDFVRELCKGELFELGAECQSMDAVFSTTPQMPKLLKYQYKVFALLFSSFDDVLFLDADCYPIFNPDDLFISEPYKSRGLITWPDVWLSSTSPTFYEVTGLEAPSMSKRRSSESSVMMIKRSTHGDDLVLATYYNLWGPDRYYRLLSQGSPGEGDKETFLQAALMLGKPFWDVRTNVGILGRWLNESFVGYGMKQAEPREDYRLFSAASRDKHDDEARSKDLQARRMFIHHNNLKIDMPKLGAIMSDAMKKNKQGQLNRLWGDDDTLIEQSGYDVEKAILHSLKFNNDVPAWRIQRVGRRGRAAGVGGRECAGFQSCGQACNPEPGNQHELTQPLELRCAHGGRAPMGHDAEVE
ncbi:hypothetical protein MCOR04_011046 [Pyricularia oryzae]|nr:hypothetical protein MCOR04_011046 [Pyricularia oryzae]